MVKKQTQKVRGQMRTGLKKEFIAFLKTMTSDDLESIFALAIANRQANARQEV